MRLLLLLAAALAAPAAQAQFVCAEPRTAHVSFQETSTGPYVAGSVYEATLFVSATAAGDDMGVSTMVVDFNPAALSYPTAPVKGVDYVWLRYDGFPRTTIDGGQAAYASEVRPTSASRLTPFVNLQFTTSAAGRAEALPTVPTATVKIRWTVLNPTAGFAITPRSQQFFNGPGGSAGCYTTGTFTGSESGQQTVSGDAGWRLLAAPAGGLTAAGLAALNHVQGVPGFFPTAASNLYTGYNGTAFTVPASSTAEIAPGRGFYWYAYADDDFPGPPPAGFHALPLTLLHDGPARTAFVAAGALGPDTYDVPLHTAGDGFNLLGNPFATALNTAAIQAVGGAFASTVVQTWDDGPVGSGTYVLSLSLSDVVTGWQGFFLENGTATAARFTPAARTTGGTLVSRDSLARAERHVLPFSLAGTSGGITVTDRAAVLVLDPAAEPGWDPLDATKLAAPTAASVTVAFVGDRDGEARLKALEARPLPEGGFAVPLAVDAVGYTGDVTLSWDASDLPADLAVSLRDLTTGATVDLREAAGYTFRVEAARPAGSLLAPGSALAALAADRFVLSVGQSAPVSAAQEVPVELALAAPVPNPFSGTARVAYALPATARVRIAVYDVLGREVAVLVDGERPAGRHEVQLHGDGLAAGVYVVRMTAGDRAVVRRVTRSR